MIDLDEYIQNLSNPDEAERIYAAEDIGFANSAEGVAPLLARLPAETSLAVREAMFAALGNIDHDSVTEGAIRFLTSEDPFLRNQAVELLRLRGASAIGFLKEAFLLADNDGRKFTIDVLAGLDGPDSSEIYSLALADADVNVVITALESLGNADKTEFREQAELLAVSSDPMLAGAALEALAKIGNHQSLKVIQSHAVQHPLADHLLPSYLKLLGMQGDAASIEEAARHFQSRRRYLRGPALNAIVMLRRRHSQSPIPEPLVEALKDFVREGGESIARHQAVYFLRGLPQTEALGLFLTEYSDCLPCSLGEQSSA